MRIAIPDNVQKHPRIVASIWFGLTGLFFAAYFVKPDSHSRFFSVSIAILSTVPWAALIGGRIIDTTQSCSYGQAVLRGAMIALLSVISFTPLLAIECEIENMCR